MFSVQFYFKSRSKKKKKVLQVLFMTVMHSDTLAVNVK